jgi:hypothetical protein
VNIKTSLLENQSDDFAFIHPPLSFSTTTEYLSTLHDKSHQPATTN